MKAYKNIETLVETRINGNRIKGNTYYENLLKNLRTRDINHYCADYCQDNYVVYIYKKIDKIDFIVKCLVGAK